MFFNDDVAARVSAAERAAHAGENLYALKAGTYFTRTGFFLTREAAQQFWDDFKRTQACAYDRIVELSPREYFRLWVDLS